jgi:hypothetical protein
VLVVINPLPIQTATWLLAIASIVLLVWLAWRDYLAWRWTVMPGLIALLYVVFYTWVLFWRPLGEWAWISAIIRLMEAIVFVTFLLLLGFKNRWTQHKS